MTRTSEATRRALRDSHGSVRAVAARHGVDVKTVLRWRKRDDVRDVPAGPRRSSVLTEEEEDMIVGFRRMTLLPLDDCLYALQPAIPGLSRSSLHRCLRRHGVARLPAMKRSRTATLGQVWMVMTAEATDEGPAYHFLAIDRVSKLLHASLYGSDDETAACRFLDDVVAAIPYRVEAIETADTLPFCRGRFSMACVAHGIRHLPFETDRPTGRIGIDASTATVRRQYASRRALADHMQSFGLSFNRERRLKTLGGLTPYEFIRRAWLREPDRFRSSPFPDIPGLDSAPASR